MTNHDLVACEKIKPMKMLKNNHQESNILHLFITNLRSSINNDTLTRIRNSNRARINEVKIIKSNLTYNIVKILKQEGFIEGFDIHEQSEKIIIKLKYKGIKQIPYISNLSRISRSGSRVYVNKKKIPRVFGGIGIAILTSR